MKTAAGDAGEFRALVASSSYNAFTSSLTFHPDVGESFARDATEAYSFCSWLYEDLPGALHTMMPLQVHESLSLDQLRQFRRLSPTAKADVLAFETLQLHELTHIVDLLTTPFGATFHGFFADEFVTISPILEYLSEHPEIDLAPPFRELTPDLPHWTESLGRLRKTDRFFRAMRDVNPAEIKLGWKTLDSERIPLYGNPLTQVTVLGEIFTVLVPWSGRDFLRISSILEARALANCLRHLINRFRNDVELAREELHRYLEVLYSRQHVRRDYWLLLDLLAGLCGKPDYPSLIADQDDTRLFDQVPSLLSAITWFALHGPDSEVRCIMAILGLQSLSRQGVHFDDAGELLDALEKFFPNKPDVDTARLLVLQALRNQQAQLDFTAVDREVKEHLDYTYSVLIHQIGRQVGTRWVNPLGMPWDGNPFRYFDETDAEHLGGRYQAPARVHEWVKLRELLMVARHGNDTIKRKSLSEWVNP